MDEDGSDTGTLAPVYLQLGAADGAEQVPVALGRQRPAHRRQIRTAGQRRADRATVTVDRHQADDVQATTDWAFEPRRLPSSYIRPVKTFISQSRMPSML